LNTILRDVPPASRFPSQVPATICFSEYLCAERGMVENRIRMITGKIRFLFMIADGIEAQK
jgi:hypothetical protein